MSIYLKIIINLNIRTDITGYADHILSVLEGSLFKNTIRKIKLEKIKEINDTSN